MKKILLIFCIFILAGCSHSGGGSIQIATNVTEKAITTQNKTIQAVEKTVKSMPQECQTPLLEAQIQSLKDNMVMIEASHAVTVNVAYGEIEMQKQIVKTLESKLWFWRLIVILLSIGLTGFVFVVIKKGIW